MVKVVFLLNTLSDNHIKNRIAEFLNNGYDVEVYGFDRKGEVRFVDNRYEINSLGVIISGSYFHRLYRYCKGILKIKKLFDHNVIFYVNSLDLVLCFVLLFRKARYLYEEVDLVYTYLKIKSVFKVIDKLIIKKSLLAILTSEGFAKYHFGEQIPDNVVLVPNRLNPEVVKLVKVDKQICKKKYVRMGFVGSPRFETIFNVISVICSSFPDRDFEIFGGPIQGRFKELEKYPNCHLNGFFKNPDDLPFIYSQIDVVLCTYDVSFDNVRYAEPNKLYEAIYFDTPIVVSKGTFLAEKVMQMGIGYEIDGMINHEIVKFVQDLTVDDVNEKIRNIQKIDKSQVLNVNNYLFEKIEEFL